jgi:predicted TIM-barrel fold metal-dependent hydrolase
MRCLWVRKSPHEYLHERFLFTTQPCDEPDDPRQLATLVSLLGPDILCFSSDYPHSFLGKGERLPPINPAGKNT